jgi:hypothetical protein
MSREDAGLQTSSGRCGACPHSPSVHGERGCTAFVPGTALAPPRACPCDRDALAALHAAPKKPRHLIVVE